jgi:hypothetical protein
LKGENGGATSENETTNMQIGSKPLDIKGLVMAICQKGKDLVLLKVMVDDKTQRDVKSDAMY